MAHSIKHWLQHVWDYHSRDLLKQRSTKKYNVCAWRVNQFLFTCTVGMGWLWTAGKRKIAQIAWKMSPYCKWQSQNTVYMITIFLTKSKDTQLLCTNKHCSFMLDLRWLTDSTSMLEELSNSRPSGLFCSALVQLVLDKNRKCVDTYCSILVLREPDSSSS